LVELHVVDIQARAHDAGEDSAWAYKDTFAAESIRIAGWCHTRHTACAKV